MELRPLLVVSMYVAHVFSTSHYGNEFYIGMIQSYSGIRDIQIDVASQHEGSITIDIPFFQRHETMKLKKGVTTVHVDSSIVQNGNYTAARGIQLTTDSDVSVFVTGIDYFSSNRDTYLALPFSSLGNNYNIASYTSIKNDHASLSEYILIGTQNYTEINVTYSLKVNISNVLRLNELEINAVSVTEKDLSYRFVSASEKLSVISGSSCAFVPHASYYCNLMIEQMVPSQMWTNHYIVPSLTPKRGFVLRLFSLPNIDENVCFTNTTGMLCKPFRDLENEESVFYDAPVIVSSHSPFAVEQYGFGHTFDNIDSRPFMMNILGINNYLNRYFFAVPAIDPIGTIYLSIIVPAVWEIGLLLDGFPINSTYERQAVPSPFSNYTILKVIITAGYHELFHENKSVTFGALVYGLGLQIGYGFPVGFGYANAFTQETTPSLPSTPTATSQTTTPTNVLLNTTGSTCYSCDDMSHVELCDVIQRCKENEICYVEKYATHSGIRFKSGCMSRTQCLKENQTKSDVVCMECCSGNYCNNRGCGENRFPDRNSRGPMCYDCQHVLSPQLCNRVALCLPEEVCSIEKYTWGTDFHYKMGCTHHSCAPMRRTVTGGRVERSTPVCSSCCSDDFCNNNCTQNTQPVIIG